MFSTLCRTWPGAVKYALLGCVVLGLAAGPVAAQQPDDPKLAELKARIDRLEQQNQQLIHLLQHQKPVEPAGLQGGSSDEVKKVIEKVLNDRKKAEDDKKKADDEKKKKEDAEKGYEVGSDLVFAPSWKDGLFFENKGKDFRAHVGGRVHQDWGFFNPDPNLNPLGGPAGWQDGADFRRARLRVDGSCWEVIDWVAEVDFATGVTGTTNHPVITDMYFDIKQLPHVGNFRAGHMKEPFSLEQYGTSSRYIPLMERSPIHDALDPQRNIGLMVYNHAMDERLAWATGFFRTNSDNSGGNSFDYGDGEYAYTSRAVYTPIFEADGRCMAMFGGAFSHRCLDPDDATSRARYSSRAPLRVGSPTLVDTGALLADNVRLFNFQAAAVMGSFWIQGEYMRANVNNALLGGELRDPVVDGYYVMAGYFLTGEHRPWRTTSGGWDRVRPNEPFFCVRDEECGGFQRGWGAWELVARYGYLHAGDPELTAATRGTLTDVTFGVNWYLNPNFKVQWNYVHAWRNVPAPAGDGEVDMLGMRFAFDF